MKRFALLAAVLTAVLALGAWPASASRVVRTVDGDTFHAVFHGTERTFRLYCVDAPERKQPYGAEATRALDAMLRYAVNDEVSIRVLRSDRYGRSVARVRRGRHDIGLDLVAQGLAWDYRSFCKDPAFAAAEDAARAARIGLWADDSPISPSDWRKGVRPSG